MKKITVLLFMMIFLFSCTREVKKYHIIEIEENSSDITLFVVGTQWNPTKESCGYSNYYLNNKPDASDTVLVIKCLGEESLLEFGDKLKLEKYRIRQVEEDSSITALFVIGTGWNKYRGYSYYYLNNRPDASDTILAIKRLGKIPLFEFGDKLELKKF